MDEIDAITQLLREAGSGEEGAMDQVFASVYPRLRQLARARRQDWHGDLTMNTTALIHEAYLKVAGSPGSRFRDRGHFFASAARAMRQVLISYARTRRAGKRGGGERAVTLDEGQAPVDETASVEILSLEEALVRLESTVPRQGRIVECLFFAGFTIDETAEALELSPATVKRDWSTARAWLYREMRGGTSG